MTDHERTVDGAYKALVGFLIEMQECAVAVSGGVDSMTLAAIAHKTLGRSARMYHAVSPAVPVAAHQRVQSYARKFNWNLVEINANEMGDENYRANPINRCYFCKSNLYGSIRSHLESGVTILSGTNFDDLADYRPGLQAASEHNILHPYVSCSIGKTMIRKLAVYLELNDLAELPASPCLSSRIQTGIPVQELSLKMIDVLETETKARTKARNIRGRLLTQGVVMEVDQDCLEGVQSERGLTARLAEICEDNGLRFTGFAPYKMGSAFVHGR